MNITRYQKLFGVGPLGVLIGVVLLCVLLFLDRSMHHAKILERPEILTIVGSIFLALWFCWHVWCIRTISRWWRHGQLCTTGPYRFVRHPIYAGGTVLGASGIALMFNSWIMLLLPVLLYATYFLLVRNEETMMKTVFGEEYERYAARTGRLLPRIKPSK